MKLRKATYESGRVRAEWEDGATLELHPVWLRDNCTCERCRHPKTNQRLIRADAWPEALEPEAVSVESGDLVARFGDHETRFSSTWLSAWGPGATSRRRTRFAKDDRVIQVDFAELDREPTQREFLSELLWRGVALVKQTPIEKGFVLRFASRFGVVRRTNYGELFDVEAVVDATHLAYTPVPLDLHTDNPYRDPVPGLQFLHCLESTAAGGESVFVDGVAAAEDLRRRDPAAFRILTETPVPFRYRDDTTDLRRELVLIERVGERVDKVRFNDRSMAPLDATADEAAAFYAAYRAFAELVLEPERAVRFRLEPGDLVAFDNERVLHGRGAFASEGGRRHLQGCYADRDAFESALRVLERSA